MLSNVGILPFGILAASRKSDYHSSMRTRLLLIAAVILGVVLAMNTSEFIPGVYITRLPFGCELAYYDKTRQPVFTIAASCPHKDMIRLWPWPVTYPWFEEPYMPGELQQGQALLLPNHARMITE
jgi:hypothetical protein